MQSKRGKVWAFLGFVLFLYLFIFSIVLIKESFFEIGKDIFKITQDNLNAINGFGVGWLLTLIMQSSGATTSALIALNSVGVIGTRILIYMILGTRIGTTITALFVALLIHAKKRRDFRHGFEIGLTNLVYALPIAIFMFLFEYFFSFFSKTGNYFLTLDVPFKLKFIDSITLPLINFFSFLPKYVLVFLGIIILIVSLRKIPKFMLDLFGAGNLREKINKYMANKWKSFLIGFLITAVLLSTSITLSLLIPLIVLRLVNLRKVIPYMVGANLGGVTDAVLGGLAVGKTSLPAIFTYVSFSIIGLVWLFNIDLLLNITKYISKRTLRVSKKRAVVFLLFFILLAILLAFI